MLKIFNKLLTQIVWFIYFSYTISYSIILIFLYSGINPTEKFASKMSSFIVTFIHVPT